MTAGLAQNARAPRQPKPTPSASGTLTPEAVAANKLIVVEYSPVYRPTRSGKRALMRPGKTTLRIAMPIPAIKVPTNSPGIVGLSRMPMPAMIVTRPSATVRPVPRRLVTLGTTGENSPKDMRGKAALKSMKPLDSCKSA